MILVAKGVWPLLDVYPPRAKFIVKDHRAFIKACDPKWAKGDLHPLIEAVK